MKPIVKRILLGVGGLVGALVLGGAAFAGFHIHRFDSSMDKVYDVPVPNVVVSTEPAVIERGRHLSEALAGCTNADCHGADLGGGKTMTFGPLGTITGPNVSKGGIGAAYSPGELFRLVRHGLKKDGRSVRFMPSAEMRWLPDSDITAVISYLATLPPVTKPNGPTELGALAKILDRFDMITFDVARSIDHHHVELAPPPSPTPEYGRFVAKLCTGCHGANLSGGPLPGAPPELPPPSNITPHASGIAGWAYEDFDRLLTQGIRKNGKKLDPFMPISGFGKMDETEKRALYSHLMRLEPLPYGGR